MLQCWWSEPRFGDSDGGASADRLVERTPKDGWGPLCKALGMAVPAEPFPHVNTTDEFNARVAAGPPPGQ